MASVKWQAFFQCVNILWLSDPGFELNMSKMGSWNHMEHTGNYTLIIKDFIRQMCVLLENSVYFGDEDGFNSNPACSNIINIVHHCLR